MLINLKFNPVSQSQRLGVNSLSQNPVVAVGVSAFSMVSTRATSMARSILDHPVVTGICKYLPESPVNKYTGILALGVLSGCDGGMTPIMMAEVATGVSLLAGAGWLVKSALTNNPRQIEDAREKIRQLEDTESRARDPKELATTVKNRPDVTIDILTDIDKEIIDKLAACSKTKIDWDSVIAVCDDLLGEMRELGVSSDSDAYRKVTELKIQAEMENQTLAEVAGDLMAQAQKVPSWIEGQRIRVERLREKLSREQRLADLKRRVTGLVGHVEDLKVQSEEAISETERLTAEIVATQELLQRVDALTEVEAYLALPMIQDLPETTLSDLREKVALKRRELQKTEGGKHG